MRNSFIIFSYLLFISGLISPLCRADSTTPLEKTLSFQYEVNCTTDDANIFPGVSGTITLDGRMERFDLFKYLNHSEISLGAVSDSLQVQDLQIQFVPNDNCVVKNFTPTIVDEKLPLLGQATPLETAQAFLHSPFLMSRSDLLDNREKDVPLGLTYSIEHPDSATTRIIYTIFFSNESVHGLFSTSKQTSLSSYGRRTDVEWLYQVDLDSKTGEILNEKYQGGIFFGFGHMTKSFSGEYLPNSLHPILYDIAVHNVFSQNPRGQQRRHILEGYLFAPRDEIPEPDTREDWMWEHPWTFDVSDRELSRDGVLSAPSSDYLYVLIDGKLRRGKLEILNLTDPEPADVINNIGKDLWHEQTISAILLKPDFQGTLEIRPKSSSSEFTLMSSLKFFRLLPDAVNGFTSKDVTASYQCDELQLPMKCTNPPILVPPTITVPLPPSIMPGATTASVLK